MTALVFQFVTVTLKLSIAELTGKSLDAFMFILVHFESCPRFKCLVAFMTLEWTIVAMHIDVRVELML